MPEPTTLRALAPRTVASPEPAPMLLDRRPRGASCDLGHPYRLWRRR
jgi:hypothetical protein